jgi:hypothetical protein
MQAMDCRSFKEMLDSYLSGELAVETNHVIQRHAEHCAPCRSEMGARRQLRVVLREAGTQAQLSHECRARMRARLRAEAGKPQAIVTRFFPTRLPLAAAAAVLLALLFGGGYGIVYWQQQRVFAAELSPALVSEAVGDHGNCATKFLKREGPVRMSDSARHYNPAYGDLDQVAADGAQGLQLRAAHVCGFGGRRFAHLVYTREKQVISLLVTERDGRALKRGIVPVDDGLRAGLQQVLRDGHTVSAYQTAKHIVLVVSELPQKENEELAAQLAVPVCEHLRRVERSSAAAPGQ